MGTGVAANVPSVLVGWKAIAAWFTVGRIETVKGWHRARPMPVSRGTSRQQPIVLVVDLEQWVREGCAQRRSR